MLSVHSKYDLTKMDKGRLSADLGSRWVLGGFLIFLEVNSAMLLTFAEPVLKLKYGKARLFLSYISFL